MRTFNEIMDLVNALEKNVDKLEYNEVVLAADELTKQLKAKRLELKRKKVAPKVKAHRGIGSY